MRTPSRTRAVTAFALLPLLALAACNSKPNVVNAPDDDDMKTALANAAPITALPPSILATKTFRCADNSVVTVDFYGDNASAAIHPKTGSPIALKAPAAGQPMVGGGYTLNGKATDSSVKITEPGKDAQSCDDQ
ncbi:MAG TPA: hypothetical protein VGC28_02590 [Sphingomonas sp.]